MKKIWIMSLVFILGWMGAGSGFVHTVSAAAPAYKLYVDGKVISGKPSPVLQDGTMMVPMQKTLTALGYTANIQKTVWTAKNKSGSSIILTMNSKSAKVNGKKTALSGAPKTINGTAFIPLKSLGQVTGKPIGTDSVRYFVWLGEQPSLNSFDENWGRTAEQIKSGDVRTTVGESSSNGVTILHYTGSQDAFSFNQYMILYQDKFIRDFIDVDVTQYSAHDLQEIVKIAGLYEGFKRAITKEMGKPFKDQSFHLTSTKGDEVRDLVYSMQYRSIHFKTQWQEGHTNAVLEMTSDGNQYFFHVIYTSTDADPTVIRVLDETM